MIYIDNDVPSEEVDKRIDWPGALLVTVGLTLVIFALSQGKIAPQGWSTPCKLCSASNHFIFLMLSGFQDIIVLLILGVILIGMFLCWQRYLEKIHDNPDSPFSFLTPPPLLKLSIWTRANGRIAAIMIIAFTNWSAFVASVFWVQVRLFFWSLPVLCC